MRQASIRSSTAVTPRRDSVRPASRRTGAWGRVRGEHGVLRFEVGALFPHLPEIGEQVGNGFDLLTPESLRVAAPVPPDDSLDLEGIGVPDLSRIVYPPWPVHLDAGLFLGFASRGKRFTGCNRPGLYICPVTT